MPNLTLVFAMNTGTEQRRTQSRLYRGTAVQLRQDHRPAQCNLGTLLL